MYTREQCRVFPLLKKMAAKLRLFSLMTQDGGQTVKSCIGEIQLACNRNSPSFGRATSIVVSINKQMHQYPLLSLDMLTYLNRHRRFVNHQLSWLTVLSYSVKWWLNWRKCISLRQFNLFALVLNIQYIPRNMHTVFALLCFVVVIHGLISHIHRAYFTGTVAI